MKKITSILFAASLMLAVACSKDNKANRQLDGAWTLSTINGVSSSDITGSYTFAKTKKNEGTLAVAYSITFGGTTQSFTQAGTYKIVDEMLISTMNDGGTSHTDTATIVEITKSSLTLSSGTGTDTETIIFDKQ